MARKFSELVAKMSPESRARADARYEEMRANMPLYKLRDARDMTQVRLATKLGTTQASVSKLERRTDMYLSTLRRYVEAMGGELEIVARFPDGDVRIDRLGGLQRPEDTPQAAD